MGDYPADFIPFIQNYSHAALSPILRISKSAGVISTHTDVRAFVTNRDQENLKSKKGEM